MTFPLSLISIRVEIREKYRTFPFKRPTGFTLLELLAVIVILGTLLAFAFPRFSNFKDRTLRSDARKVSGLIRYIDDASATKKFYYRVWFNLDRGLLKVEFSDDGVDYVPEPESRLRGLALTRGVEFEDVVLPGLGKVHRGEVATVFSPYGSTEPFTLHMKSGGRTLTLYFNPYTNKVKILDGYV